MADKRMFNKKLTGSDAFMELSASAQALYFHLNQEADDDGFNNQINLAMYRSHASLDDLRVLIEKSFIIRFDSGVIVIKHWRMHNTLRKDRYVPTNYQEEFKALGIKENGAYTLDGCQTVAERLPQIRLDKNSIDKISIDKNNIGAQNSRFVPPTLDEIKDYIWEKGYKNVNAEQFYNHYESNGWMVGKTKMKKWKSAVATWEHNGFGSGTSGKGVRGDSADLVSKWV